MNNPSTSIIIVNWNGISYLKTCLYSLKRIDQKDMEIIVVDNSSTDNSVEFIKENFPKVLIIENSKNLGFAEGSNIGFQKSRGKYILFLNNDTEVTSNFLSSMIKVLESDQEIGGVQSKILLKDNKKLLDSIGAFFTNTGFLYHYGFRKPDLGGNYDKQINIYSAKGACMLFKRNVLEDVLVDGEVFDKRYFAYFEETDLCHRVWLSGKKIVFVPESIVYHKVGATSSRLSSAYIQYHSFKNRVDSYIKNLSSEYLLKVFTVHLLLCFAVPFYYLLRGKPLVSLAVIKAFLWNVIRLFSSLKKRRFIQTEIRKVKDSDFLPGLTKPVGINYFISHFRGLEKYPG